MLELAQATPVAPIDVSKVAFTISADQVWACFGLLGALLTWIVIATTRAVLYMRDLSNGQKTTNTSLLHTNSELVRLAGETWTRSHQTDWVARAQRENPAVKWPIPEGPETPRPMVSFTSGGSGGES